MIQFLDSESRVRPDLLDKEALKVADSILRVSPTQMRRIFDQIKQLVKRIDSGDSWQDVEPLVRLQKAQLVYTMRRGRKNGGRDREMDWDNFMKFMDEALNSVKTEKDYRAFSMMMEAVYAYHYARTKERI